MNWHDPAVAASLISSIGTVLAAMIAAGIAAIVGVKLSDRRRLIENLNTAMEDIAFLLHVEQQLCANEHQHPLTVKRGVRSKAKAAGLSWSGKFTPGRARRRRVPD